MLKILPQSDEKILAVQASGELTHEDYEAFLPLLDAKVQSGDHVYLLLDITQFDGMTAHAMVDEFLASMKYWWNFEAVAVVGNKKWEKYFTRFGNYLSPADTRYFDAESEDQAWIWLRGETA